MPTTQTFGGGLPPPPPPSTPQRPPVLQPGEPPPVQRALPSGSAGGQVPGPGQPYTPYGGVYPQPEGTEGIGEPTTPGILSTTSLQVRPLKQVRHVVVACIAVNPGVTAWATSGVMPSSFTVQDAVVINNGTVATSTLRFGTSKGAVVDGPTADAAQSFLLGASASNPSTQRLTIPCYVGLMPFYNIDQYINDVGTRLWMEFFCNDSSPISVTVIFTIAIESGSESVP